MSRVITFSRVFPKGHLRAGEQTHFVEKIWKSFMGNIEESFRLPESFHAYVDAYTKCINDQKPIDLMAKYFEVEPKHHTIRAGNRWKVGDKFSPRIWSGKPYASKQIQFAPDIEIKKIWTYETDILGVPSIDGYYLPEFYDGKEAWEVLAQNDGLSLDDFISWFNIHPKKDKEDKSFKGQILCWNDSINYA